MAIEFDGVTVTRGSEYLLMPEDITIDPTMNGRHDTPDVSGLIADILKRGQLQPVVIRKDGGRPVLVAGFSRWRAISEINAKGLAPVKIKVRCIPFKGDAKEAFLANIAENKVRNQTTPMDDAHNIAKLERWGIPMEEIAAAYHEKEAWVRDRLALLSLGDEGRKALQDGALKPTAAIVIAKLSEAQQSAALAKVAERSETTAPVAESQGGPSKRQGKASSKAGKGNAPAMTTAAVKAAAAAVTGKPAKVRYGWAEVREIIRAVNEDGKLPDGFKCTRNEQDAIDKFCYHLLGLIGGHKS